jgi:hypothetical protein
MSLCSHVWGPSGLLFSSQNVNLTTHLDSVLSFTSIFLYALVLSTRKPVSFTLYKGYLMLESEHILAPVTEVNK